MVWRIVLILVVATGSAPLASSAAGDGNWTVSGPYLGPLVMPWVEVLPASPREPGFVVMTTELTVRHWRILMAEPPPYEDERCGSPDCPALRISGLGALMVANRLSDLEGLPRCYELGPCLGSPHDEELSCASAMLLPDCVGYRFPSFEEWLLAATAGTGGAPCEEDDHPCLTRQAHYLQNSGRHSHPVAQLEPNAWGLYDMFGNATEAFWPERPQHRRYRMVADDVPGYVEPLHATGGNLMASSRSTLELHLPPFLIALGFADYLQGIRLYRTVPPIE